MDNIPLSVLFGALVVLILMSAFFSSSETAMMSLNRYRLKHLTKAGHPGAKRASELLEHTDRLIGLILLGNNFVNILASSIATIIALRLYGETGIAIATGLLTLIILIFAEVTPKTLAALHPERIAFAAAFIYIPLIKILYPLVWLISVIANGILRILGVKDQASAMQHLSREELRTVVNEAGALIPRRHQQMLLGILDLEKVTVEDIMIPRNEIIGIDLNEENWDNILDQLTTTQHTRLPLYRGDINNIVGIVHVRNTLRKLTTGELNCDTLEALAKEPYYIPEGTSLNSQLLNFQHHKRRIGMVVDEYGDIHGLVTLEDILEEIVGEFTTDASLTSPDVHAQEDGSYLVTGSANIRELNRTMNWRLPTDGPKTLNGLIIEYLESIPSAGTSLLIANYPIEIVQTAENTVKIVRISPRLKRKPNSKGMQ
jgi:Mg2+/Co2+ transporter CorB